MSKKLCAICGKEGHSYLPFCYEHLQEKNAGKIVKCEDCGTWHYVDQPCKKCGEGGNLTNTSKTSDKPPEYATSELTCIICGEPSNGKHFCKACYTKYKDKTLYIKVAKCVDFVKLEAEYQSDMTCDDGHMVKSPSEKIIDDWLFKEGINHAYETTLNVDKTHDIHPDWYIPEYNGVKNIYIEYWGIGDENKKYAAIKNYKKEIYPKLCEQEHITVLYLEKSDLNNANASLKKKLKYLTPMTVNE